MIKFIQLYVLYILLHSCNSKDSEVHNIEYSSNNKPVIKISDDNREIIEKECYETIKSKLTLSLESVIKNDSFCNLEEFLNRNMEFINNNREEWEELFIEILIELRTKYECTISEVFEEILEYIEGKTYIDLFKVYKTCFDKFRLLYSEDKIRDTIEWHIAKAFSLEKTEDPNSEKIFDSIIFIKYIINSLELESHLNKDNLSSNPLGNVLSREILDQLLYLYALIEELEGLVYILNVYILKGFTNRDTLKDLLAICYNIDESHNKLSKNSLLIQLLLTQLVMEDGERDISVFIKYFFENDLENIEEIFDKILLLFIPNNLLKDAFYKRICSESLNCNKTSKFSEKFEKIVKILKNIGMNINLEDDIILRSATEKAEIKAVEILARNGSLFNAKSTKSSRTALGLAILKRHNQPQLIEAIISLYKELKFEVHQDDKEAFNKLLEKGDI